MVATLKHFERAAADVGAHGDNDMLPFDVDISFVKEKQAEIAQLAFSFYERLRALSAEEVRGKVRELEVFFERLLVPAGAAGFRISTKIHPFWTVYLNGLAVAVAEAHEPLRQKRVHSYRYAPDGASLFDRTSSWRSFREACVEDCRAAGGDAVVVQADITSFYEHVYHHRIESLIGSLFQNEPNFAIQIDRFLGKFSSGRSFGLPVGGQFSRIFAELLLSEVDKGLSDEGLIWRRFVDDFVLIAPSQEDAYSALAKLSHALADYGLTLNRTKTSFLKGSHFVDYVHAQLGGSDHEATKLREIDLHFDPYSDAPVEDYEDLRETVQSLQVQTLLDLELNKSQPDTFLVAQIGRTLRLHSPAIALQLCRTLLSARNLHAFRASWSTIMRGISAVRADQEFSDIAEGIDFLLDEIPNSSSHLLAADASCLHYLRTLRFRRTEARGRYLRELYRASQSQSVRRACIDCWRQWKDRTSFFFLRNRWAEIGSGQQRMLWLAAKEFDDDGRNFRMQVRREALAAWALGLEEADDVISFAKTYMTWSE